MLNVAVIGSGPAGLYAAEALVKQAAALSVPVPVLVDVIDPPSHEWLERMIQGIEAKFK